MRTLVLLIVIAVLPGFAAGASTCAASGGPNTSQARWKVDHYIYDASLHRDWEVLVDCEHPDAPARMELVPFRKQTDPEQSSGVTHGLTSQDMNAGRSSQVSIKAGEVVEVASAANSLTSISMRGVAMQTAFFGQRIRIRLSVGGHFVYGIVRGSHSVQLAAAAMPGWRKP
ncbi:MAG: hypothetical protein ACRD3F_04940 [Acidobacteriaceae bacterium]